MTHSLLFDLIRGWLREQIRPKEAWPEYQDRLSAVLPIFIAAIVAVVMVALLMWLPGIP